MLSIGTASPSRPTALPAGPAGVGDELAAAAQRCLHGLPEHLLRAMETGLRVNADGLTPGALFRGRYSGGCAVGVTLRELDPDAFRFGRIEFWLWHRWRRGVELDVARRLPGLDQLQRVFDDAVGQVQQAGQEQQPSRAVGLWLAASAEAVLRARELPAHRGGPLGNVRTRWKWARAHDPAEMETSSCS